MIKMLNTLYSALKDAHLRYEIRFYTSEESRLIKRGPAE